MKKVIQLVVGCSVSALMVYIVFGDAKLSDLQASFDRIVWWPVAPFVILFGLHYVLRSVRWRYLLPESKRERPTLRHLFDSIILGNLATCLLPFRLGEFIRPLVLARWTEYRFGAAFISVVIERFFDLSTVLISFFVLVQLLPDLPEWLHVAAYSLGMMALALLLFLVGGCLFPSVIHRIVELCVQPLPHKVASTLKRFASDLLDGAAVIKTPSRLLIIIGLTALVWLTAYLQFQVVLWMFPFNQSFLLSVALGVFVALAIALPSAPGFVGVFQIGCVAAASLFAYPESDAKVYSLVAHGLTYVMMIIVGFWLLAIHDLNLFELKKEAEQGSAAADNSTPEQA
jgi:uncharacterized protein (TIRG00374 family)